MTIRGDWVDGEILKHEDINDTFDNIPTTIEASAGIIGTNGPLCMPIGSIIGWLKSFTNTPTLTGGWVQCDGQTLSDAESPYNGVVIPNLNSTNLFLRGSTSSGSVFTDRQHNHTLGTGGNGHTYGSGPNMPTAPQTTGGANNAPPYYTVVFIMRIK